MMDILFARTGFWDGVSRILDIGAVTVEFNRSPTPELADFLALRSDWRAVGDDLSVALTSCEACLGERRARTRAS